MREAFLAMQQRILDALERLYTLGVQFLALSYGEPLMYQSSISATKELVFPDHKRRYLYVVSPAALNLVLGGIDVTIQFAVPMNTPTLILYFSGARYTAAAQATEQKITLLLSNEKIY